jgi:peroxiredoxin
MLRRTALLAALLLARTALAAEPPAPVAIAEHETPTPGWIAVGDGAPWLAIGDPAPAFSYLGVEGEWHSSHELIASRPVLLLFGARDEQLRNLERGRKTFGALGVEPVAVLDMRTGSAAHLVRRLGFDCRAVVDPQCAIGELFGSLDPVTRRHSPAGFVIDAEGRLRGAFWGPIPPTRDLVSFAARSLGLAMPEPAAAATPPTTHM